MKQTFLILSNQPFDSELKTNKWHVAQQLARCGYDVVYVDPPVRFKALKRFAKSPSFNLGELFFLVERKKPNLKSYPMAHTLVLFLAFRGSGPIKEFYGRPKKNCRKF